METHVCSKRLCQTLCTTIIDSILAKINRLKTVSHQIRNVTYPQLFLILNTLRKSVNDCKAELILTNVEVLEALITTKIGEKSTQGLFIPDCIVLERQRLKFRELCKLLCVLND